jgi:NAD(P)H-nitrite reductase large subunit
MSTCWTSVSARELLIKEPLGGATGAEPTRLPVPGCDDPGVRVVRSLDHARELVWRLRFAREAIVTGLGFTGCDIDTQVEEIGRSGTMLHVRGGELIAQGAAWS